MKNKLIEFHSCYDELLSKLFLMSHDRREKSEDKEAITTEEETSLSLLSNDIKFVSSNGYKDFKLISTDYKDSSSVGEINYYDNKYDMTAHEIIVYSLLLHKCIESQIEIQEVSYGELQRMRNKRVGNKRLLDIATKNAYINAIRGLCKKRIKYNLGETRKRRKITYREAEQPLLIITETRKLDNGDRIIKYSLGPFGKTLIESKRYSTLVPSDYFRINFNEIMSYQIALYICKIIYIERFKKSDTITLKLNSIMKNINKFVITDNYVIASRCSLYDYHGENTKRYWDSTISKVNKLLETLKYEYKIKDFKNVCQITDTHYGIKNDYQNVKWLLDI